MVFVYAVVKGILIMVSVAFVTLVLYSLGVVLWPLFHFSFEAFVSLFVLAMGLVLFAKY